MLMALIKALVQDGFGYACLNSDGNAHAVFVIASDAQAWCDLNMGRYHVLDLEEAIAYNENWGKN